MQFLGPIERQEVPGALKGRHLRIWYQRAVMLALGGPRPVAVSPDKQHWNLDTAVILGRRLPACRVAQQAQEGAVMPRAIPHQVHFLQKSLRNAVRVGNAAT